MKFVSRFFDLNYDSRLRNINVVIQILIRLYFFLCGVIGFYLEIE